MRKVYYIDVGNMPKKDVIAYLEKVKVDMRAKRDEPAKPSKEPGLMNDVVETLAVAGSFHPF